MLHIDPHYVHGAGQQHEAGTMQAPRGHEITTHMHSHPDTTSVPVNRKLFISNGCELKLNTHD